MSKIDVGYFVLSVGCSEIKFINILKKGIKKI